MFLLRQLRGDIDIKPDSLLSVLDMLNSKGVSMFIIYKNY